MPGATFLFLGPSFMFLDLLIRCDASEAYKPRVLFNSCGAPPSYLPPRLPLLPHPRLSL